MPLRVYFFVCENLYAEMKEVVQFRKLTEVEVRSFPARCGSPPMNWTELADIVTETEECRIEVLGSYCLDQLCPPLSSCYRINRQEQCFHLLCGASLVNALQEKGAQLLTPGWLSRWEHYIKEKWGFDRSTAQQFFGESVKNLILLDTGTDARAADHFAALQEFLSLPGEILPVGLDFLGLLAARTVEQYQLKQTGQEAEKSGRRAADAAMTLDLIGMVTRAKSRPEVVAAITDLFTMLFAPEKVHFLPVNAAAGIQFDQATGLNEEERLQATQLYTRPDKRFILNEAQDSFFLRIGRGDTISALIYVVRVAFPQYIDSYLNAALTVSEVCALSIEHVQALKKLFDASRLAGKAEVATEVLHNVGNTLNSISVSSEYIREMVHASSSTSLSDVVRLIQEHEHDREHFCTHDPRGKKLPFYFARLAEKLHDERQRLLAETTRQLHHIQRLVEIIRVQQDEVRHADFTEQLELSSIIEESLELYRKRLADRQITVERNYTFQQSMHGEPHKILQVVNNLIINAVDAFDGTAVEQKKIFLNTYPVDSNEVVLEISDNGKGLPENALQQIFSFGFTTKENGHGFGLHNAVNLVIEMGGSLTAESSGPDQGATFRMRLPVTAAEKTE
ncbi:MAG: ATP-binding protein [Candidatus Electrothrix sp. YB6]